MKYTTFYSCKSTQEIVNDINTYQVELGWAANIVFDIMREDGDFFGLTDSLNNTIQFLRQGDEAFVDFPDPTKGGSHSKTIPMLELPNLIKELPETIIIDHFEGLQFNKWQ